MPRRMLMAATLACRAVASSVAIWGAGMRVAADGAEELAVTSLAFSSLLALLAFSGPALGPGSSAARLGLGPGRAGGALVAALVAGTLALSYGLDGILSLSGLKDGSALADFDALIEGARGRLLAFALLGFGIAPGIGEELLCRGLVQRGLTRRLPAAAAIGVAALFFGALHVEPVHGSFATLLGLYLGLITHLTGSVRPAIVCHVANNLTAVASAAWGHEIHVSAPSVAVALLSAGVCLWLARQRLLAPPAPATRHSDTADFPRDWKPRAPRGEGPARPAVDHELLQPGTRSDDR